MISVILPVYNTAAYLSACLDSVLAQTYRDIEVILVDDGSTDGSAEVCDDYACRDARVTVLHQENGGPSAATISSGSVYTQNRREYSGSFLALRTRRRMQARVIRRRAAYHSQ